MRKPYWTSLVTLFMLLALCPIKTPAQGPYDYIVTVANEQLHFVSRPELGYVVVSREETIAVEALDGTLREFGARDIREVRGLGRRGVSVVFSQRPANENENTITMLKAQRQIKYVAPLFSSNSETVAIIPEIVVRMRGGPDDEQLQALCGTMGLVIKKKLEFTDNEYLIEVLGGDENDVFWAVEQLNQNALVKWVVPNVAFRPRLFGQVIPDDTYFANQWHLNNTGQSGGTPDADIDAPEAWEITTGDPDIIVAVLDDGVDTDHPDLINNIVPGYDFVNDGNHPNATGNDAHGTACAGLIAAQGNNGIGVTGVSWNCKIMPIKIAEGDDFISSADIATAIRWAAHNDADIMSNSWGGDFQMPTIHSAIVDVAELTGIGREGKGCVLLFASGNWVSGGDVIYPAAYGEVIAVGATDVNDEIWYYSGSGPQLDVVAPSGRTNLQGNIWTTDIAGTAGFNNRDPNILDYTDKMGGTSGACPIAAGVAALVLSIDSDLTNAEVFRVLARSAVDLGDPGRDEYYGCGRIDASAALNLLFNPAPYTFVDDDALNDPGPGNPNISDPNEDGSPEHPFDTIQEGIDNVICGGDVVVALGTYQGEDNRDLDFHGKPIILRSSEPTNPNVVAATVIDCESLSRGINFNIFGAKEGLGLEVSGLTISNGYAGYFGRGGGVYGNNNPITISYCIITNNLAGDDGGGIHNIDGLIKNCIISNNTAGSHSGGGGLAFCDGPIINCTISGNIVPYSKPRTSFGGGLYRCHGPITNCIISNNSARDGAGLRQCDGSITNCIISNNVGGGIILVGGPVTNCVITDNLGQGMYIQNSEVAVTNCIVANNDIVGINTYSNTSSIATITNCIVWGNNFCCGTVEEAQIKVSGNMPVVSYTCIEGLDTFAGSGNIGSDPCFADPCNGDYHLKSQDGRWKPADQIWIMDDITSPCIDAGDPNSDWTTELWPHGKRINMGAYGGTPQASMSLSDAGNIANLDNDPDDIVDFNDLDLFIGKWLEEEILIPEDLNRDGVVNFLDYAVFAQNWLAGL